MSAAPGPLRARGLFAGPGASRALLVGGTGTVELVGEHGAYARLPGGWLLLCAPEAPFGPLSLSLAPPPAALGLAPGASVCASRQSLRLGAVAVSLERLRQRPPPQPPSAVPADAAALARTAELVGRALPPPPALLSPWLLALAAGRERRAVVALAGLGEGLTPAGEDVLAGYAAARLALAPPARPSTACVDASTAVIRRSPKHPRAAADRGCVVMSLADAHAIAERCTPIGLAYLRCAERGELPDAAAALLGALCCASPTAALATVAELGRWGASSGVALGWGILAGVHARLAQTSPNRRITGGARWPTPASGLGSTYSRTPRSSTLPPPTVSSRWRAASTPSSTRS